MFGKYVHVSLHAQQNYRPISVVSSHCQGGGGKGIHPLRIPAIHEAKFVNTRRIAILRGLFLTTCPYPADMVRIFTVPDNNRQSRLSRHDGPRNVCWVGLDEKSEERRSSSCRAGILKTGIVLKEHF